MTDFCTSLGTRRFDSRCRPGFSLIELLAVLLIAVILGTLLAPAISGIQGSFQLTKSAAKMRDNLQLARQLAITGNTTVFVSLCKKADLGGAENFNTLLISVLNSDQTHRLLAKPVQLPAGFSVSETSTWSSLVDDLGATNISVATYTNVPCRQFRFRASGATDLATTNGWHLTIFNNRVSAAPEKNFVTLQIDPRTGRVVAFQP